MSYLFNVETMEMIVVLTVVHILSAKCHKI